MALSGPVPIPEPLSLTFPASISFEDEAVPFYFDVSNGGDEATPNIDWGFKIDLFSQYQNYITVHSYHFDLPDDFVIEAQASATVSGLFHPSRTHVTVDRNVYYDAGLPLTQGIYRYQITVNRTINNNFYFPHDYPYYYSLNHIFRDEFLSQITILGNAEFKKTPTEEFACGTVVPFKPVIRNKIIRCGRIGEGSTTKTVTKPKTTTTTQTETVTETTTNATTTTTEITTTETITITITDPTLTISSETNTNTVPPGSELTISLPDIGVPEIPTTRIETVTIPGQSTTIIPITTTTRELPTVNTNFGTQETLEGEFVSKIVRTLGTQTTRLADEFTVRPIKHELIRNLEPTRVFNLGDGSIPIRIDPVIERRELFQNISPRIVRFESGQPLTSQPRVGQFIRIEEPELPPSLRFIISPSRAPEVLETIRFSRDDLSNPNTETIQQILESEEFQDEFFLAQKLRDLHDKGEISTVFYTPQRPDREVPLKFVELDDKELSKSKLEINSPIINYWEAIDTNPPNIDIPIETSRVNQPTRFKNLPKHYVPFLKNKKVDRIEEISQERITIPILGAADPDSFEPRSDFTPVYDKYGLLYPGGYPLQKELINRLWKYYTVNSQDHRLKYVSEDLTYDRPNPDDVRGALFNALAGDGLLWPEKLNSWLIPWSQQNEDTLAGSFLIFNPRLYKSAEIALGFSSRIQLAVETPKEERAELAFDNNVQLPDKIVLMLKGNNKESIESYKTSNPFVDNSLARYEVITDIDEMTERFTPPGEVIYVHYDDPILRLMLHPAADIRVTRDQLTLKGFGDQELIYTIPHTYIIIPTDNPRHTSLRGGGSLSLAFGHRSLTLTQSTDPEEWNGPSKPVMSFIGDYIDVWGYEPYMDSLYLGENYRYPEGTFKLIFNNTTENFRGFKSDFKYIKLTPNIFEEFLEKQSNLTVNDVSPSFNDIVKSLGLENNLKLQNSMQSTVVRELVEGEVTGRAANLEVVAFNPAKDTYYVSTGDVINEEVSGLLDSIFEISIGAGPPPTFPPVLGS